MVCIISVVKSDCDAGSVCHLISSYERFGEYFTVLVCDADRHVPGISGKHQRDFAGICLMPY